jgi:nucleoside-diphosphate-sugar epimerase
LSRVQLYIKARLLRGTRIETLGPNEARVFFDAGVSLIASLAAATLCAFFVDKGTLPARQILALCCLPFLLLIFNGIFGIYSRLKLALGRKKALVVAGSVICSAAIGWALAGDPAAAMLWASIVYGPLALARLIANIANSQHKKLASLAVNQRGPVLVIGGAGYIGSHTVDLLLAAGQQVRVLDRLMYGGDSLAEFKGHRNFELIEGDATDITKLTQALRGASSVIHLAGLVGDPACAVDPTFTRHANIVAARMAKDMAQSLGISRFIFASSCSVYGTSDVEVTEEGALNPVSLYAQTKIDSEKELLFAGRDEFFVTVLRFATVFGHSRRPRFDLVANLFTAQAMTDGVITVIGPHQWRPFVHVRDLARAILLTLKADPFLVQDQVFNVGDKRLNLTILQLAEIVKNVTSKYRDVSISVSENAQDRRNYAVSFEKIRSLLGFEAATLMEDGIDQMATSFLAGRYQHYRQEMYSNLAMTSKALSQFQNPDELAHLYAPLKLN